MPKTLIITNDFPTRQGGIETFVKALADRFDPNEVVVYTARMPGDAAFDATLGYPVVRDRASTLLPTPRVRRQVLEVFAEHGCDRVLVGSSVPLGLLAPAVRAAGARQVVAMTHGHEIWWSRLPGTRQVLRKVARSVDVLTYVSAWCHEHIGGAIAPVDRTRMRRLAPGVDVEQFRPGQGGEHVRARLGLSPTTPMVLCAARLVERKGQDTLIESWPQVLESVPDARLVLVGKGPAARRLADRVRTLGLKDSVTFVGPVTWQHIPGFFDAADVFAMPSRTRLGGLEPEALGIVFLEAAACEKPVLVGRSGGAPDAVQDGVTGYVVDPRDDAEIAGRIVELLRDPELRRRMGTAGRARAERDWTWDSIAARVRTYLDPDDPDVPHLRER
ncbi:MAG: glycosyltransferase family 4 protein [Cellulomonadaceae bacterium]